FYTAHLPPNLYTLSLHDALPIFLQRHSATPENTTYWVEFDPTVKGLMWERFRGYTTCRACWSPEEWEPAPMAATTGLSPIQGRRRPPSRIFSSTQRVPSEREHSMRAASADCVHKSIDNGKTCAQKIAGIEKPQHFTWRIVR